MITNKEKIMQVATRLFLENGYEHTSIQHIISESNVSKGGFYYHFTSKEEVFNAIASNEFMPLVDTIMDIVNDSTLTLKDKIAQMIYKKNTFYLTHFEKMKPIYSGERHLIMQFKWKMLIKRLMKPCLEKLIAEATIITPETITFLFGLHEMLFEYIIPDADSSDDFKKYLDLLTGVADGLPQKIR